MPDAAGLLRRPRRVLVTGGAGFIGSAYLRHVLALDDEVVVVNLDALTYAGALENLADLPDPDRHHFVHGNIADRELVGKLIRQHQIDAIVNFAAETHVDRSIHSASPFLETNVLGTLALLEAARLAWLEDGIVPASAAIFHHISTDEVFGTLEPEAPAFRESTPYAPRSPYAASKAAADHLVRAFAHTYGLPILITNCSNNYGPRQFPEKLIALMIFNALAGQPLPIYGDGAQVRDWLFVDDHCRGLWLALTQAAPGATYNLGSGSGPTNLELVGRLCRVLDELRPGSPFRPHASLIRHVADRPGHDRRYAMDSSAALRDLGWGPTTSLDDGLRRTVAWYLENEDWMAAIRARGDHAAWMRQAYSGQGGG